MEEEVPRSREGENVFGQRNAGSVRKERIGNGSEFGEVRRGEQGTL